MKKILFVFGTRPEAIKMAPLVNVFKKDKLNFETIIAVTGQHREMLDQVLSIFKIEPQYDLNLMSPNQTLESLTGKILIGISQLIDKIIPDLIFVQGDTTTTYATGLGAFYKKIPVAHIEAGLRTNDKYSPFPEEMNRRMTTAISTFHFPPTDQAKANLLNDGVPETNTLVVGNTVIDALLSISSQLDYDNGYFKKYFESKYSIIFNGKKTILVTGHRRESFGKGFENICFAIKEIATNQDIQIVYPVHLNPNVQNPVNKILGGKKNIFLIPPQDYIPFVYLMKNSYLILTDSGGIQEEAPSLDIPVLVMRENTERYEGIESGTARLVGTNKKDIIKQIDILISDENEYSKMSKAINPFGDGNASEKIYDYILGKYQN